MVWNIRGLNPSRGRVFFSLIVNVQTGSEVHPISFRWLPGIFLGGKSAGAWNLRLRFISAGVKNEWNCSSTHPVCSNGVDRDFTVRVPAVEWKRNVMAHAQKPDLVFQRNGRVHLYRRGCQFSRLLAAEVCASAVVMLDSECSDTVQDCWLLTPFASFPFTSPPVRHRVPPDSVSTLPVYVLVMI